MYSNSPPQTERPGRAKFMYRLGYLVLAFGALALLSAIATGRPAAAALSVACLYLTYNAWRMNADEVRRVAQLAKSGAEADAETILETQPVAVSAEAVAPVAAEPQAAELVKAAGSEPDQQGTR